MKKLIDPLLENNQKSREVSEPYLNQKYAL